MQYAVSILIPESVRVGTGRAVPWAESHSSSVLVRLRKPANLRKDGGLFRKQNATSFAAYGPIRHWEGGRGVCVTGISSHINTENPISAPPPKCSQRQPDTIGALSNVQIQNNFISPAQMCAIAMGLWFN